MSKRTYLCVILTIALLVSIQPTSIYASNNTATPTSSKVFVNGEDIAFDAYNIDGNNYFKLRDLAYIFNGTQKQFGVVWDNTKKAINLISNKPYTPIGGEMSVGDGKSKTAVINQSPIYKDGAQIELNAYTINGNNYFKLRDIGEVFDICVEWDGATKSIIIDTSKQSDTNISTSAYQNENIPILTSAVDEAYSLGIAWEGLLAQKNTKISMKDMLSLIKNADDLSYGEQRSNYLTWIPYEEDEIATRIKVAELIYNRQMERALSIKSTGDAFYQEKEAKLNSIDKAWIVQFPNASLIGKRLDGTIGEFDAWTGCADIDDINNIGDTSAVNYVINAFNKLTGDKIMKLYEDNTFRPQNTISTKEAILIAYNYYHSIEPDPEYLSVEDVGTYNKDIITDELLNQQTKLPDATNEKLPAWKGFNIEYMGNTAWRALACTEEDWRTEAEIRTIAETGANFIRLWTSFSRYEAPAYGNMNQVNMYYLEHLDQIIAWGMKYGVHIQLTCTDGPGMDATYSMEEANDKTQSIFTDTAYRNQMLKWYRMFARRYADIPNNFLSFNLLNECDPVDDANYGETFAPIIEAIWEESPDRVIVADVHSMNITGKSMAKLGVALSYHIYRPGEFCVVEENIARDNPKFYASMAWPYAGEYNGKTKMIDGADMLEIPMGIVSLNDVKAIADKNHVGFMVGEFGIFENKGGTFLTNTIPREVVYAMLTDIIKTMDEREIPWAANWVENYSVAIAYPINKEAVYEKIEGSTFYMDARMVEFFQNIIRNK